MFKKSLLQTGDIKGRRSDQIEDAQKIVIPEKFPSEKVIRDKFRSFLKKTQKRDTREEIRQILKIFVHKIILTPKTDSKTGEDIEILLNLDAWLNLWNLIKGK